VLRVMKSGASAEEYKDWCVKNLRKSREEVRTKQLAKQMHDEFILTYAVPAASVMTSDVRKIKHQLWVRGFLLDTSTWQPHHLFQKENCQKAIHVRSSCLSTAPTSSKRSFAKSCLKS
jgi:hypothetical protein